MLLVVVNWSSTSLWVDIILRHVRWLLIILTLCIPPKLLRIASVVCIHLGLDRIIRVHSGRCQR